jgi:HNH endonuclease
MNRIAKPEIEPGEIISYTEMCLAVGAGLQRGMNFRLSSGTTVILMSRRLGAPYEDQVSDDSRTLIYEGHDCSKSVHPYPKQVDQPERNPGGSLTQNGLFAEAIRRFEDLGEPPEKVKVFEKIRDGIWVYNGVFDLIDYIIDSSSGRRVFKFTLTVSSPDTELITKDAVHRKTGDFVDDDRIIPSWVKLEVWKRDKGRCVTCGAQDHLHFDHIIPYSKGGSSKDPANVQILCLRHNLLKHDRIE